MVITIISCRKSKTLYVYLFKPLLSTHTFTQVNYTAYTYMNPINHLKRVSTVYLRRRSAAIFLNGSHNGRQYLKQKWRPGMAVLLSFNRESPKCSADNFCLTVIFQSIIHRVHRLKVYQPAATKGLATIK